MNIGKLCISVTADSVGELIAKAERAAQIGDLVELRLDHLDRLDILKLSDLANKIPLIATFRCDSDEKRLAFWNSDKSPFWACDLEEDIIDKVPSCGRRIISYHHHQGVPADLTEIYERLSGYGADLIKIAATAVDATDAIPVWNLLERAKHDRRRLVAIAMGEAGTWTRILGPAHGSAITYASLDDGQKTAAGQITAHDSLDVYRVKEISGSTGVYGIIGDPVSHSLSPFMQNAAFAATGEDAVFVPFLVKDIDSFITRMVKRASRELELNFAGFRSRCRINKQ
jgi:3-dehydroquinate dehydratase / shikimate dehydrogenase